jgi:hypothetical protein
LIFQRLRSDEANADDKTQGETMLEKIIGYFAELPWDVPGVVVVCIAAWVLVVLVRWHTEDSRFDLRHVLIDARTDRVSLHKMGQFVALVVSTMVLWYEMMHSRLTEWLFVGYMVTWAGATLAKRWIDKPAAGGPSSEESK